jgi:hypothetical protein
MNSILDLVKTLILWVCIVILFIMYIYTKHIDYLAYMQFFGLIFLWNVIDEKSRSKWDIEKWEQVK